MPEAPVGKGSAWTWLRYCVPALLALCTAAAPRAAHAQFRAGDRILEPVDASRWSVMRGHLRPVARAQFDRGELDPATRLGRVTMFFSRTVRTGSRSAGASRSAAGSRLAQLPSLALARRVRRSLRPDPRRSGQDRRLAAGAGIDRRTGEPQPHLGGLQRQRAAGGERPCVPTCGATPCAARRILPPAASRRSPAHSAASCSDSAASTISA